MLRYCLRSLLLLRFCSTCLGLCRSFDVVGVGEGGLTFLGETSLCYL